MWEPTPVGDGCGIRPANHRPQGWAPTKTTFTHGQRQHGPSKRHRAGSIAFRSRLQRLHQSWGVLSGREWLAGPELSRGHPDLAFEEFHKIGGVIKTQIDGDGLNTLRAKTAHKRPHGPLWAGPVGTVIGLVEMLFGTAGPLVVAWLSRRLADAEQIRASTPMIIAAAASTVLAGMAWDGQLASDLLWQRWTGLIGVALLGVWLGHRLAHHVPMARLRQIISTLLVVSGLMLAWGALR